jgi:hypothetical protein
MGEPIKLAVKPLSPSERKKRRIEGLAVSLDDTDPKYFPSGDPHSVLMRATPPADPLPAKPGKDQDVKDTQSDRSAPVLRSDLGTGASLGSAQPGSYGNTVGPSPRHDHQTRVLRSDHSTRVPEPDQEFFETDQASIPLSELQWAVWQELQRMGQTNRRTCYEDLAKAMNQKKRGLQRAIEALKREGAIKLVHIKSKEFQGFSVEINPYVRFHLGSKKEVYGIVKRGQTVVPRHYGLTVVPRYSEHSIDLMRRYMTASPEARAEIDQLAERRVGRLLATMSPDKHEGLREEARLECAREYFTARANAGEGRGMPENP